ncbi:hypothetical protein [Halovenus sp. HT40]|uniref:hypothetical protein n=1 Tax=Halovenus sp. HT40 TaxID=3126691 RepID=UPI00300F455B
MSGDDSDRSLGGKFADVLDSLGLENLTDDYRDHKREADDRLERAFEVGPKAVATTPELAEVDKVNVHRDGGDVLVPVVTVIFEDGGEPAMETVWRLTDEILSAIHPVFRDQHVRHYDIQFGYANAEETEAVFRRMTAQQELAEEFVTDPTVDIEMLRERIEAGDDGDDGVPPVYWQVFDARSPAGSGAYAGPAPIYAACQREPSSAVGEVLAGQEMVYTGGAAGF